MSNQEIANRIYMRWRRWCRPSFDDAEIVTLLAISQNLEVVFDGSRDAEIRWLQKFNRNLRSEPLTALNNCRVDDVLAEVISKRERKENR